MSGRRSRSHASSGTGSYPRSLRVNQVLRQVVAEELERLADADERLRLLTVTSVDTAPDLRHATVYCASLDEDAAQAVEERRHQLQAHVGRQVRLKRTPVLEFAPDPAVSAGARVEEVLRRLGEQEGGGGTAGETAGDAGGSGAHDTEREP
jgi:ribosome-binding factor A